MTDSKIHERSKTVVVDKLNNKVHWSHLSLCLFHRSKVFTLLYAELVKWHTGGCLCLACVCVCYIKWKYDRGTVCACMIDLMHM